LTFWNLALAFSAHQDRGSQMNWLTLSLQSRATVCVTLEKMSVFESPR